MVGDKIREIRKEHNMTQEELAEKIGVKRSVISKYETGSIAPPLNQLQKISEALSVEVADILEVKPVGSSGLYAGKANGEMLLRALRQWGPSEIKEALSDISDEEALEVLQKIEKEGKDIAIPIFPPSYPYEEIKQKAKVALDALSPEGLSKAYSYISDLAEHPKYRKSVKGAEPDSNPNNT